MPRKNIETYSVQDDMRRDIMMVYREVAPNCLSQFGAWKKVAEHPAKRYYIGEKKAIEVVKRYFEGKDILSSFGHYSRLRYESIINEVIRISQEKKFVGKPIYALVKEAVRRPAPSFFIAPNTVRHIFERMKNKKYDEYGRLKPEYKY